jgi:PRC-barrel domain
MVAQSAGLMRDAIDGTFPSPSRFAHDWQRVRIMRRGLAIIALCTSLIAMMMLAPANRAFAVKASDPTRADLLGSPVFASDGAQVGEVADIATASDGTVTAVKFKTGRRLGFGERSVLVQKGMFIVLRGAVVLDFPAEAVGDLPPAAADPDDK